MDTVTWVVHGLDAFLITPYRWPGNPVIGWWLGSFVIALWCALLGMLTSAFACRANASHIREVDSEVVERHNQSMNALKAGDRSAYKAINKLAKEAYGKSFFLGMTLACASLWPPALALAWMQTRFSDISFPLPVAIPLIGETVSYPFVFIPIYILARIILGKTQRRLNALGIMR